MTTAQKLTLRLSEVRRKLAELSAKDEPTTEETAEQRKLLAEYADLEVRHSAALVAETEDAEKREREVEAEPDAERRERIELRGKASLTNYVVAAVKGQTLAGAEAELQSAAAVDGIPLELWDTQAITEARKAAIERRADMNTGAPATVGVNLDVLQPAVFAPSILPRLGVDMPRVPTGTYATGTISTSLTAGSRAAGAARESSAAAFTVGTATPKSISARLSIRIEDVAAVGQANFEAVLRENLSLALSDELDRQGLTGAGGNRGADLMGLMARLTDPSTPAAGAARFDTFVAAFAGGIDGLWAARTADVAIVAGVDTYRLSARTFRDTPGMTPTDLGGESFADYAMTHYGGWWTNRRMPDTVSNVQQAILYRSGAGHAADGHAHRGLPKLERPDHRRYLHGQCQRNAALYRSCAAWRRACCPARRIRPGRISGFRIGAEMTAGIELPSGGVWTEVPVQAGRQYAFQVASYPSRSDERIVYLRTAETAPAADEWRHFVLPTASTPAYVTLTSGARLWARAVDVEDEPAAARLVFQLA